MKKYKCDKCGEKLEVNKHNGLEIDCDCSKKVTKKEIDRLIKKVAKEDKEAKEARMKADKEEREAQIAKQKLQDAEKKA